MTDIWSLHFNFGDFVVVARMREKPSLHVTVHANEIFKNLTSETCIKDRFGLMIADFKTNEELTNIIKQERGV